MVKCPITNKEIDIGDCIVTVDVSDGCVNESALSEDVKSVPDWEIICRQCEYHNN